MQQTVEEISRAELELIPEVTIFIPAYNEAGNLPEVVRRVDEALREMDCRGELVLVDDGSTDDTAAVLERLMEAYPILRVFHHPYNLGLSEAMNTGFRMSRGQYIVFLPSDLESDPAEDIPKLVQEIRKGHDIVVGWRQNRDDGKQLASRIYNLVCRYLFGIKCHDMNWIKAFRADAVRNLQLRSDWHRFLLILLASRPVKISEVKTNWHPRKYGQSKFGTSRFLYSFLDVLVVKLLLKFSRRPMLLFGTVGLALIATGVAIDLYLVVLYLQTLTQQRPILLFSFVLILAGLLVFLAGFMAELIIETQQKIDRLERNLSRDSSD